MDKEKWQENKNKDKNDLVKWKEKNKVKIISYKINSLIR